MLHAGFLLGLLFDPEDGGNTFLKNAGSLSPDYTALNYKRPQTSQPPLCENLKFNVIIRFYTEQIRWMDPF
jgi:hypothetical protein